MRIDQYIKEINITDDDFVIITLAPGIEVSEHQCSFVSAFSGSLFIPMRERKREEGTNNVLQFDVKGYEPLNKYIQNKVLDFIHLKELFLQITNLILSLQKNRMQASNLLLTTNEIFVNISTGDIKLIYTPIETSINPTDISDDFSKLLREIAINVKTDKAHELLGFVLGCANSEKAIDIEKFAISLNQMVSVNPKKNTGSDKNNSLHFLIVSEICFLFSSLFVASVFPAWELVFGTFMLNAYFFSMSIFVLGSILTIIVFTILKFMKKDHTTEKGISTIQSPMTLPNIESDMGASDNQTDIRRDIPTFEQKSNYKPTKTESFSEREYNPVTDSLDQMSNEVAATTLLNADADSIANNETQLLIGNKSYVSYIIKEGKTSVIDRIMLNKQRFTVGRQEGQADLLLRDVAVSKTHFTIETTEGESFISDLNSSNGTFLNGIRIQPEKPYKLQPGDKITIVNQNYLFYQK